MSGVRPILILYFVGAALLAVSARTVVRPVAYETMAPPPPTYRVRVNTADEPTLCLLPGVGPGIAKRIITHRETRGPFRRPDDLEDIPYVGPLKRQAMEPWVAFE